jgi:hypothetical protein
MRPTRGDGLILLAALLLLAALYLLYWQGASSTAQAQVLVNGKIWARLDVFQNQDLAVPGPLGISRLQVRDGAVRFVDSPCPNKLCILQGPIRHSGDVVVCLPNLVSVQIPTRDPRFDSINF